MGIIGSYVMWTLPLNEGEYQDEKRSHALSGTSTHVYGFFAVARLLQSCARTSRTSGYSTNL